MHLVPKFGKLKLPKPNKRNTQILKVKLLSKVWLSVMSHQNIVLVFVLNYI